MHVSVGALAPTSFYLVPIYRRKRRHQVDPHRWNAQLHDPVGRIEVCNGQPNGAEAELLQGCDDLGGVGLGGADADLNVAGIPLSAALR